MPTKDLRYYTYTIYLKSNAYLTAFLLKCGGLRRYQAKNKQYFHTLYDTSFGQRPLALNPDFDGLYFTYTYFDSRERLAPHLRWDAAGVAMCRSDVPAYYNPLFPAHYALVCYNDWLKTRSEASLDPFWRQVEHLYAQGAHQAEGLFFYYHSDVPHLKLAAPWYAGITQALAASVFLRAYKLSGAEKWREAARQSLQTLFISVAEKGVFCVNTEGYAWIEEYPSHDKRNLVLNGFVFCLIALYEYLLLGDGHDNLIRDRAAQLTESLFKSLHHYRWGKFTKYSLYAVDFQNIEYQGFMVFQWQHLYHLTSSSAFLELRDVMAKPVDWSAFARLYALGDPRAFTYFL